MFRAPESFTHSFFFAALTRFRRPHPWFEFGFPPPGLRFRPRWTVSLVHLARDCPPTGIIGRAHQWPSCYAASAILRAVQRRALLLPPGGPIHGFRRLASALFFSARGLRVLASEAGWIWSPLCDTCGFRALFPEWPEHNALAVRRPRRWPRSGVYASAQAWGRLAQKRRRIS
jgi:hypothetical protein